MSYVNPKTVTYSRDLAVADAAWAVNPPPGATKVRVKDIQVSVTTTYTADTTAAILGVGVTGSTSALGYISLGTTAAGSAVGLSDQIVRGTNPAYGTLDLTGSSNTLSGTLPEVSGPILITFTANTGGTPAGAGVAEVTLDWF